MASSYLIFSVILMLLGFFLFIESARILPDGRMFDGLLLMLFGGVFIVGGSYLAWTFDKDRKKEKTKNS